MSGPGDRSPRDARRPPVRAAEHGSDSLIPQPGFSAYNAFMGVRSGQYERVATTLREAEGDRLHTLKRDCVKVAELIADELERREWEATPQPPPGYDLVPSEATPMGYELIKQEGS